MTVRGLNLMFEPGKVLLLSKIEKIYSMQELILSIDLIINKYFFIIVGMDKICFNRCMLLTAVCTLVLALHLSLNT